MASSNAMAELAVVKRVLPGSLLHITRDCDNGSISGLYRCV